MEAIDLYKTMLTVLQVVGDQPARLLVETTSTIPTPITFVSYITYIDTPSTWQYNALAILGVSIVFIYVVFGMLIWDNLIQLINGTTRV